MAPRVADIIKIVAEEYDVTTAMILGSSRKPHVTQARHQAMLMVREMTDLSYPEIGLVFNKDHTTVVHAVQKLRGEIRSE